jgi:hypothetical protein
MYKNGQENEWDCSLAGGRASCAGGVVVREKTRVRGLVGQLVDWDRGDEWTHLPMFCY